jgi:hypothetical protein
MPASRETASAIRYEKTACGPLKKIPPNISNGRSHQPGPGGLYFGWTPSPILKKNVTLHPKKIKKRTQGYQLANSNFGNELRE